MRVYRSELGIMNNKIYTRCLLIFLSQPPKLSQRFHLFRYLSPRTVKQQEFRLKITPFQKVIKLQKLTFYSEFTIKML